MLERFVGQTSFVSQEDFKKNFKVNVPENFNFGYDVVDAWAEEEPEKKALCWTNDKGEHIDFTFAEMKKYTDQTAAYFQSLGIGRGDMVMLILKRRYEFWFSIIALHKLGAVVIPATHLLTKKDIVYRANAADIKMIVCAGEEVITKHIEDALPESPTIEHVVSVGPFVPSGFHDFHKEWENVPAFVRPVHANSNDDISLLYFTSGTTGNPKMVAHDFTYPLGHITTGCYWHNLHRDSLHLTIADTGWGKAVWGKLYGQWIAGVQQTVADAATGDYTDNPGEIKATEGVQTAWFYVIPQQVSAFAITANVKVVNGAGDTIKDGTISASVPTTDITSWSAQYQYLYSAQLNLDQITDPDNPNPQPIEFTGSVSDNWENGTGDITITEPQP